MEQTKPFSFQSNVSLPLESAAKGNKVADSSVCNSAKLPFPISFKTRGSVIQGPLALMSSVMYAFFLFVNLAAQGFGWAPQIRVYQTVLCLFFGFGCVLTKTKLFTDICIVFFFLECTRFIEDELAMIVRLYSSIIPFAFILIISREAHLLIAVIFYCSIFTIFLQSGTPRLRTHIMIYICLFITTYCLCVVFLIGFYRDSTGMKTSFGRILEPEINFSEELFFVIVISLLGIVFLLLERYIKVFTMSVLKEGRDISKLETVNAELRREISKYKGTTQLDLDSPLTKVLTDLKEMASGMPENDPTSKTLLGIVQALTTSRLYVPDVDFTHGGVDAELGNFLESTLVAGAGQSTKDSVQQQKHTSVGSSVELTPLPGSFDITNSSLQLQLTKHPVLDAESEKVLNALMENTEKWDFSIFEFSHLTSGRPLYHLSLNLIRKYHLDNKLGIDKDHLENFLDRIEQGYRANPYHSALHAADVLQAVHYFIKKGGLIEYMSDIELFAALIAAAVHDYDHPGRNNMYLVNTQSHLAMLYNDHSVLENYHCSSTFKLILEHGNANNIIYGMAEQQKREFRETLVSMILATDMAQHFEILGQLKAKLTSAEGINFANVKDRLQVLQVMIKCADISNSARSSAVCRRWADLVVEEFFLQGDDERRRGIPVSVFMDRTKPDVAKCQVGFISYIVGPLYQELAKVLPNMEQCLENLETNLAEWQTELNHQNQLRTQ